MKMPKISKNGHFWPFSRKKPFFRGIPQKGPKKAFLGPLPRGFYINPSGPLPGEGRGSGEPSGAPGDSRGPQIPGSGDPGPRPRPGPSPGGGPKGAPGDLRGPGGSRTRSRRGPRGGFTSTPRAGAPRYPGAVPGTGGPGGSEKGLPGSPGAPLPRRGLRHPPRYRRAGVGPRRGSEGSPLPPSGRRGRPSGADWPRPGPSLRDHWTSTGTRKHPD